VANTTKILRNGIHISKKYRGVFCFPLIGHPSTIRFWPQFLRRTQYKNANGRYNGFVFRLVEEDMPAGFGNWIFYKKPSVKSDSSVVFHTLDSLKDAVHRQILFFIFFYERSDLIPADVLEKLPPWDEVNKPGFDDDVWYQKLSEQYPQITQKYLNDPGWALFAFEDIEIVISRRVSPDRIVKIISQTTHSGRQQHRQAKLKMDDHDTGD